MSFSVIIISYWELLLYGLLVTSASYYEACIWLVIFRMGGLVIHYLPLSIWIVKNKAEQWVCFDVLFLAMPMVHAVEL